MSAQKFTRNKDYSDDADNNAGGRDYIDPAGLDGEMDEIATVTDDHADKLDILLRSDDLMQDNLLQGHEFSDLAISVLGALLNLTGYLVWKEEWVTATDYSAGNLVYNAPSAYICITAHTSDDFATDLAAGKWQIYAAGGSAGLPSLSANKVLSTDGATVAWTEISLLMAPLLAPKDFPTLTNTVSIQDAYHTRRIRVSPLAVTFAAGGNTFDFSTQFMKTVAVTGNYTGACTASNMSLGSLQEIHFYNTSGAQAALSWDANWVWMGYKPDLLAVGKKAVLSLRVVYSADAAGVVALWSVQP